MFLTEEFMEPAISDGEEETSGTLEEPRYQPLLWSPPAVPIIGSLSLTSPFFEAHLQSPSLVHGILAELQQTGEARITDQTQWFGKPPREIESAIDSDSTAVCCALLSSQDG
ncbi:unnamed protein product [Arctogadus glacialis]